jgi:hypothetical protein
MAWSIGWMIWGQMGLGAWAAPPPPAREIRETRITKETKEVKEIIRNAPVGGKYQNVVPPQPSDNKPRIPKWDAEYPNWSMELSGTLSALGGTDYNLPLLGAGGTQFRSYQVEASFEWLPKEVQPYGVLSAGLRGAIFPMASQVHTSSIFSLFSVGGLLRYQLRYFGQQWIVPYGSVGIDYFQFAFKTATTGQGSKWLFVPVAGISILLNAIDRLTTRDLHSMTGLRRFYLFGEFRFFPSTFGSRGTHQIRLSGNSFHFGLRVEF